MIDADGAIERGEHEPAVPRDAASVILVDDREPGHGRDHRAAGAVRAFLLVRHATLAFAPRMAVFPGGGVDPRDFDEGVPLIGPDASAWAARLDLPAREARALITAAVRETFEETGVLLATRVDGRPGPDPQDPAWRGIRRSLEAHERPFAEVMAEHGLALRGDLLTPWARWTTPRFEPRRYRVWFFVARLPAGQSAAPVSTESASGGWQTLDEAIAAADSATVAMLPPQYFSLAELRERGLPDPGLATERALPRLEPRLVRTVEGTRLELPEEILRFGR
jgi:8-oxo-dGTP pyrophosphatase MutT (NUDIX family)